MKKVQQILPAVAAAIFNDNGEILLQKRNDVNQWCVISGHVEFGETIEEAVLREVKEEANAEAAIVRLIGVYSSPKSQTYRYPGRTVQYVTSYFEVKLSGNFNPAYFNAETRELKFFSPKNIPGDLALINADWLNDALDKRGKVFVR